MKALIAGLVTCLLSITASQLTFAGDDFKAFVMPSKNIYCTGYAMDDGNSFRCDIHSGLRPQPKSQCELDWAGLSLSSHGPAEPTCAGDTNAGDYPVLGYGKRWSWKGITCTSQKTGLTCKNLDGRGFFLSKESWKRF